MQYLDFVGVVSGACLGTPSGSVTLSGRVSGSSGSLDVISHGAGQTVTLALSEGALASVTGSGGHGGRSLIELDGLTGSLAPDFIAALRDGGGESSERGYLALGDSYGWGIEAVVQTVGDATIVYGASPGRSGISSYALGGDDSLAFLSHRADDAGSYANTVTALASARVGADEFVFAGSGSEHGISVYAAGEDGSLTHAASAGVSELVPLNAVTQLNTVELDGATYLVAAAFGTSSLTVMRVDPDGSLTVTDHVLDSRNTRIQHASQLDVVTVDGRVFVAASGSDDGLSLFALVPGGALVHLQSVEDTVAMALARVSGLTMARIGDELQLFTTSAQEAGLTMLRADLSALGVTQTTTGAALAGTAGDDLLALRGGDGALDGGAGRDILSDGGGSDTLSGGAGADIFLLAEDGAVDTITDFEVGIDRLDLSLWSGLRGAQQLTVTTIAGGAMVGFGGELLYVMSDSGQSLNAGDLGGNGVVGLDRVVVTPGNPVISVAPPDPPPDLWVPSPVSADGSVRGTLHADSLRGSAGNDRFRGFGGDDLFVGGGGSDTFEGGAGFDIVSYDGEVAGVVLDLESPDRNCDAVADDAFLSIEGYVGTALDDWLLGGSGRDFLAGEDGRDRLKGRTGNDRLSGGNGNDVISGDEGVDWLSGGGGNDTISGGAGWDRGIVGVRFSQASITVLGSAVRIRSSDGDDLYRDVEVFQFDDRTVSIFGILRLKSIPTTIGSNSGERLNGGTGRDWIFGAKGHDSIIGGDGNDVINGGSGSDRLAGQEGHDTLFGEGGHDRLFGGEGNDRLNGGNGDDSLGGSGGNDRIWGGTGADRIYGGSGNDSVWGETGDDWISGGSGRNRLFGDAGDDLLIGGDSSDRLFGGVGDDRLLGRGGNDRLYGGLGHDRIHAASGDDTLDGGSGNDTLRGGDGFDTVIGGDGDDALWGDDDDDFLFGGDGADQLSGDAGNDRLAGEAGSDTLSGGAGSDTLEGGGGADRLIGGADNDWLTGGADADIFVFDNYSGAGDVITDFEDGLDRIELYSPLGYAGVSVSDVAGGLYISWGGSGVYLDGIVAGAIDASDFLFV